MHSAHNRPMISKWLLVFGLCFQALAGAIWAEEQSIRHEIRVNLGWFREDSRYDQYTSFGEANPLKSESFEKTPYALTGTYTVFVSPLVPDSDLPSGLWEFYQRPSKASLAVMLQPEARITNVHDDPALGYHRRTTTDERLRSLTAFGEYFFLPHTSLSINLAEFHNHESSETQTDTTALLSRRTGRNEGLRRQYGLGMSHYLNEHLRFRVRYEHLTGDYRSRDRDRNDKNPLLDTRHYTDSELTGHHLSVEGLSVLNAFLGLHVRYDFQNYDLDADYAPVFPTKVGQQILYEDTLAQQAISLQLNLYLEQKTMFWWRGTYADEQIQRTYTAFSDTIDFARQQIQFHAGIEYNLNRMFSLQGGYGYLRQSGDVRINDGYEPKSMAAYDTQQERHSLSMGVIGRF